MRSVAVIVVCAVLLCSASCSINRVVAGAAASMAVQGVSAAEEEDNVELVRAAIPATIMTLETMRRNHPRSRRLLVLLSWAYANYAFGFLEEDVLRYDAFGSDAFSAVQTECYIEEGWGQGAAACESSSSLREHLIKRVSSVYAIGMKRGMEVLTARRSFRKAVDGSLEQFVGALEKFRKQDIDALFWTALNWGSFINLNLDNPEVIAAIPKVEAMVRKVIELDEGYYYGLAQAFLGALYAARPPALGGDIEQARAFFETAAAASGGRYLMVKVLYARYYAVRIQDRNLFVRLLKDVVDAPADILPEQRLANKLAKRRARLLLFNVDEYF